MVVPVASVDHAVLTSYERDRSVDLTAEPTPVLANFTAPTAARASRVPSATQDRVRVSDFSSLSYVLIASFTAESLAVDNNLPLEAAVGRHYQEANA